MAKKVRKFISINSDDQSLYEQIYNNDATLSNNPYRPIINSLHIAIIDQITDFEMVKKTSKKKPTNNNQKTQANSIPTNTNINPANNNSKILMNKDRSARTLSSLLRSLEKLIELENKAINSDTKHQNNSSSDNGKTNTQDNKKAAIIRQQLTQKLNKFNQQR